MPEVPEAVAIAVVTAIAGELLARPACPTDSFFELGGTSIQAVLLVQRSNRKLGTNGGAGTVFRARNLAEVAAALIGTRARSGGFPPEPLQLDTPPTDLRGLTFLQRERLLRDADRCQQTGERAATHVSSVYRVQGSLELGALRAAVVDILDRHPVLTLRFGYDGAEPARLSGRSESGAWRVTRLPADTVDDEALRLARDVETELFDLGREPLLRVAITVAGQHRAYVTVVVEHLVCDGLSLHQILNDLSFAYAARVDGHAPRWSDTPPDFSTWMDGETDRYAPQRLARSQDYWRTVLDPLEAIPEVRLPGMREPADLATDPAQYTVTIALESFRRLANAATRSRVSTHLALMAVLMATVYEQTGRTTPGVMSPLSLRPDGWEHTVGWFASVVPLRTRLDGQDSLSDVAGRLAQRLGEAIEYALPGHLAIPLLQPDRLTTRRWRPWLYLDTATAVTAQPLRLIGTQCMQVRDEPPIALRPGVGIWADTNEDELTLLMQFEQQAWSAADAHTFLDRYASAIISAAEWWHRPLKSWPDDRREET